MDLRDVDNDLDLFRLLDFLGLAEVLSSVGDAWSQHDRRLYGVDLALNREYRSLGSGRSSRSSDLLRPETRSTRERPDHSPVTEAGEDDRANPSRHL